MTQNLLYGSEWCFVFVIRDPILLENSLAFLWIGLLFTMTLPDSQSGSRRHGFHRQILPWLRQISGQTNTIFSSLSSFHRKREDRSRLISSIACLRQQLFLPGVISLLSGKTVLIAANSSQINAIYIKYDCSLLSIYFIHCSVKAADCNNS